MIESIQKVDGLELIVFDLDYTLWPFWVDTHVTPPFRKRGNQVYDAHNQTVKYYPDVPMILERLKSLGYSIGIASRTGCTEEANDLLKLFEWDQYIDYKQIYPGRKTTHINRLCEQSGLRLDQIAFFDDEHRNIVDLEQINVCSILVEHGVNLQTICQGIEMFVSRNKREQQR